MPRVVIGSALTRWLESSRSSPEERSFTVTGQNVREALEAVFEIEPQLRGYVVDERGAVRHHVVVFLDGEAVTDRVNLQSPVANGSEIYVLQALSGG